jgi:hypothetical protein
MGKRFKQVSTGLTLVCNREDVIKQYEKYPEAYIPLGDKPKSALKTEEKPEESPKTPEKK